MKKIITELRVFYTYQRLRTDFDRMARGVKAAYKDCKIKPYMEIYIPNKCRIVFKTDSPENLRGYRPDKIIIDEMVSNETKDYLSLASQKPK